MSNNPFVGKERSTYKMSVEVFGALFTDLNQIKDCKEDVHPAGDDQQERDGASDDPKNLTFQRHLIKRLDYVKRKFEHDIKNQ